MVSSKNVIVPIQTSNDFAEYKLFDDKKIYSTDEAAKILNVKKSTFYAWTRGPNPKIRTFYIGALLKIKGEELNKFILKSNQKNMD